MSKFDLMMRRHFSEIMNNVDRGKRVLVSDFRCEVCEDFIIGHCIGEGRKGRAVHDCMMRKIDKAFIELEHKKKIN